MWVAAFAVVGWLFMRGLPASTTEPEGGSRLRERQSISSRRSWSWSVIQRVMSLVRTTSRIFVWRAFFCASSIITPRYRRLRGLVDVERVDRDRPFTQLLV